MTEADARALLHDCGGFGGLEAWIAEQPWQAEAGGWIVAGRVRGRSFRLEPFGNGLFITTVTPGVGRRVNGRPGPCQVDRVTDLRGFADGLIARA
jgi:hypothetical protein